MSIFPPCGGMHSLFSSLVHLFLTTLRNILIILIASPLHPSISPFPLLWIHHIEVACSHPGVCSRLPFCVQYTKHAEPIRRLGTMKKTHLFYSFMWSNYSIIGFVCETSSEIHTGRNQKGGTRLSIYGRTTERSEPELTER